MQQTGDVTIPLQYFLELQGKARALEAAKRELEEERKTTWRLFGGPLTVPKKLSFHSFQDDQTSIQRRYAIEIKQPLTIMVVDGYNLTGEWNTVAIAQRLIERHIHQVVSAVDMSRLNVREIP
jgi:hypothetical protein